MSESARAKELLLEALERPADERAAFVAAACGADRALARGVLALLAAHEQAEERLGPAPAARLARAVASSPPAESEAPGSEPRLGDVLGPYRLVSVLGQGGFGTVFSAVQEQPVRRTVALKVVRAGMDSAAVLARFEVERAVLALMDHPHIARVLDAGVTLQGRPYFVMEQVDGAPITTACRDLPLAQRLRLFAKVCLAVQHAHSKGIIHRDLKPPNVLVTDVDGEPVPKVIDFGVAKAVEGRFPGMAQVTHAGHAVGTPLSMSPEQVAGAADVDTRADVYGLGVLLYELLCGVPPFADDVQDLVELCRRVRDGDPLRPSRRRALPADLDWITMRCLEKDRERRYPTALALAQDLERFLDGRPVEAAPPSTLYRLSKLVRRHRAAVVAALVVLLGVTVGVVGLVTGLLSARRSALEAQRQAEFAHTQEQVAQQVLAFVTDDLLGAAAPSALPGQGRDARLSEVLTLADHRLDAAVAAGRFKDAPLVEAGMRHALGATLGTLGAYSDSVDHLDKAVALRRAELGPGHAQTIESQFQLAQAHWSLGAADVAERLVLDARERALARGGENDLGSLRSGLFLAQLRWDQGHLDEASALLSDVTARLAEHFGVLEPVLLDALMTQALLEHAQGLDVQAEARLRDLVERRRRVFGADDPRTLTCEINLANLLRGAGRLAEAEAIYRNAHPRLGELLGTGHADVLMAGQGLARLLIEQGRLSEGEALLTTLRADAAAQFGETHALVVEIDAGLGRALELQGRSDEALPIYQSAHARAAELFGADTPFALDRAVEVASALHGSGRFAECAELLEQIHQAQGRVLGETHAQTLRTRGNRAILLIAQGQLELALSELTATWEGLATSLGPAAPETLQMLSNVGGVLLELGRPAEALVRLDEASRLAAGSLDRRAYDLFLLELRRGAALAAVDRDDEALALLLESEQRLRDESPDSVLMGDFAQLLAEIYRAQGELESALRWEQRRDGR